MTQDEKKILLVNKERNNFLNAGVNKRHKELLREEKEGKRKKWNSTKINYVL